MNFGDLAYLKTGNVRQKEVYKLLGELQLFRYLADYRPLLTGTIPLEIDTVSSDLDVCCEVYEPQKFAAKVTKEYGHLLNFAVQPEVSHNLLAIIIRFHYQGWPVELFGQALPAKAQAAYRHMLVEYKLLSLANQHFKESIIQLKQAGLKTEPAFCQLFNLAGEPYEAVLELEHCSEKELSHMLKEKGYLK